MNQRKNVCEYPARYCSYENFCKIYGIGLTLARKFAKEHDLTVHIGRRVLIDLERAEQAMYAMNERNKSNE